MAKREFMMLSHTMRPQDYVAGHFVSEKLDGQRAFWDGGLTRGEKTTDVGFANTDRDARYKATERRATGLWSRNAKPIYAPDWWLNHLPVGVPLDGELYMGRCGFQTLRSIVSKLEGEDKWDDVEFHVFDMPSLGTILADGEIKTTFYKKKFTGLVPNGTPEQRPFFSMLHALSGVSGKYIHVVKQTKLPLVNSEAQEMLGELLDVVTDAHGEGLMVRAPSSLWTPQRSRNLLKMKRLNDMEGTVVGYRAGRESDNTRTVSGNAGSKLLGLMGTVILRLDSGVVFEVSGFTEAERQFNSEGSDWCTKNPGECCPDWIENQRFTRGSRITFRYRELSNDGKPKEARFLR